MRKNVMKVRMIYNCNDFSIDIVYIAYKNY